MRGFHHEELPPAPRLVAVRSGHVVGDTAAGAEVVRVDGRGIRRRPPPTLEQSRIGPQPPNLLDRRVILGGDAHRAGGRILLYGDHGHGSSLRGVGQEWSLVRSASTSPKRSRRSRQVTSSSSRSRCTSRTRSISPCTSCSRPCRCFVTSPASASTATCFCTAAKLIG